MSRRATAKVQQAAQSIEHTEDSSQKDDQLVPTAQFAREMGVSRQTLDRARREGRVPAIPHGRGFAFRRTETLEIGDLRNGDLRRHTNTIMREQYEGERDARVFAAFQEGLSINETIITEKVPFTVVHRLRAAWEQACAEARKGTVCLYEHHVGECNGPPQTQIGLCRFHANRSRILSEEEALTLSGQSIPTAVHCQACGAATGRGVCSRCVSAVAVTLEGEGAGQRIVVKARDHIIAIVPMPQALISSRQPPAQPPVTDEIPEGDRLDQILGNLRAKMG